MKRKAKELQRQRQDAMKYGRNTSGYSGISGGGGGNGGRQDTPIVESVSVDNPKPSSYAATVPSRSVIVLNSCHIRLTVLVVSVSTKRVKVLIFNSKLFLVRVCACARRKCK